jgi:gamma-glutamylcyclotransferase (GGCT)/AIG2-like uncharacterized protein YtfP
MEAVKYIFVYGSLLDDRNEFAIYLKANCSFVCNARFKGILYNIGDYPGAVFNDDQGFYVYGKLFEIDDIENTLEVLDDYEGFGDNYAKPNEFVRKIREVETSVMGPMRCWVYLYNLSVDGFKQILSGKYIV